MTVLANNETWRQLAGEVKWAVVERQMEQVKRVSGESTRDILDALELRRWDQSARQAVYEEILGYEERLYGKPGKPILRDIMNVVDGVEPSFRGGGCP